MHGWHFYSSADQGAPWKCWSFFTEIFYKKIPEKNDQCIQRTPCVNCYKIEWIESPRQKKRKYLISKLWTDKNWLKTKSYKTIALYLNLFWNLTFTQGWSVYKVCPLWQYQIQTVQTGPKLCQWLRIFYRLLATVYQYVCK